MNQIKFRATVIKQYGLGLFILALVGVIAVLEPSFVSGGNIADIFISVSLLGIVSLGLTVVLTVGGVDMSIGHIAGFAAVVAAMLMKWHQLPTALSVLVASIIGVGLGGLNGLAVSLLGVDSFIATLSMMFVLIGLRYWLTGGVTIMLLPPSFTCLGRGSIFGIPVPLLFLLFISGLSFVLLRKTRVGRYMYMIGGNINATWLAGVSVRFYTFLAFLVSGAFSSLSGLLLAARQGLANVDLGDGFMMDGFTVALLGVAISGGRPTVLGTLVATFLVVMLVNGLNIMGVGPEWIYLVKGAIILCAIFISRAQKR
ncbi:MAG: ABC transporter permease [Chloroflexi bacterium]|nr:ABC transporter permease [Chloroflexota bacterium]